MWSRRTAPGPRASRRPRPWPTSWPASASAGTRGPTWPCCSGPSPRSSPTGPRSPRAGSRPTSWPGGGSSPTTRWPTRWPCWRSSRTPTTSRPSFACSPRPTRPRPTRTWSSCAAGPGRRPDATGPARAPCCPRRGRWTRRARRWRPPRPCGRCSGPTAWPGWWRARSPRADTTSPCWACPTALAATRTCASWCAWPRTSRRCGGRTCAASSRCSPGWRRRAARTPGRRPSSTPTWTPCAWRRCTPSRARSSRPSSWPTPPTGCRRPTRRSSSTAAGAPPSGSRASGAGRPRRSATPRCARPRSRPTPPRSDGSRTSPPPGPSATWPSSAVPRRAAATRPTRAIGC